MLTFSSLGPSGMHEEAFLARSPSSARRPSSRHTTRGSAIRQRAWLITRRFWVQIPAPLPPAMQVAIVGSRSISDPARVASAIAGSGFDIRRVISGGARGVDQLAAAWALERSIPVTVLRPDWTLGRSAGLIRNAAIVETADALVAVWDGASPGTWSSIRFALQKGIPVHVVR